MGRQLPGMTQLLVDVSDWVRNHAVHIVGGALILTVASIVLYCSPFGRLAVDRHALRIPVIGNLLRLAGTASFSRALGILVRSGITLLEGLRTVEDLLNNRYLAGRVVAARQLFGSCHYIVADLLPKVVDHLTPEGQVPQGGDLLSAGLSALGGLFGKA